MMTLMFNSKIMELLLILLLKLGLTEGILTAEFVRRVVNKGKIKKQNCVVREVKTERNLHSTKGMQNETAIRESRLQGRAKVKKFSVKKVNAAIAALESRSIKSAHSLS